MGCQKCQSQRILSVGCKTSDCCYASFGSEELGQLEHDGYVPSGIGIGGGDYLEMNICMDCGQVQGKFPVKDAAIKEAFGVEEEDEEQDAFSAQLSADAPPPRFPVRIIDGNL